MKRAKDIRVTSWAELQDALFHGSWNSSLQRYRSHFVCRGLSDANYLLETSLMRLGGPYAMLERSLLRNFKKYAQGIDHYLTSLWHLLAIAQHHGLPTRLLDWTYSPYIALHFATANHEKFNTDGAIWVVDYDKTHQLLPPELLEPLKNENAQIFTVELLSSIHRVSSNGIGLLSEDIPFQKLIESLIGFDAIGEKYGKFLLFFEPPSINDRIVNQFALFSVMPTAECTIDRWLDERPDLFKRLIIPSELKWEIRDKLDQSNITERVLFPGLDGLSTWLRRHYSPKK